MDWLYMICKWDIMLLKWIALSTDEFTWEMHQEWNGERNYGKNEYLNCSDALQYRVMCIIIEVTLNRWTLFRVLYQANSISVTFWANTLAWNNTEIDEKKKKERSANDARNKRLNKKCAVIHWRRVQFYWFGLAWIGSVRFDTFMKVSFKWSFFLLCLSWLKEKKLENAWWHLTSVNFSINFCKIFFLLLPRIQLALNV